MSGMAPRRQVLIAGADVPQDLSDSIVSVSVEDHAHEADMASLVIADPDMKWVDSPLLEPGKKVEIKMGYGSVYFISPEWEENEYLKEILGGSSHGKKRKGRRKGRK